MDIDIKQLKSLMRALRRYDLSEIELRQGDEEIVIRRGGYTHSGGAVSGPAAFPLTTGARGIPNAPPDLADSINAPISLVPSPPPTTPPSSR